MLTLRNVGSILRFKTWDKKEVVGVLNIILADNTCEIETFGEGRQTKYIDVDLCEIEEVLYLNTLDDSIVSIIESGLKSIESKMEEVQKELDKTGGNYTEYYYDELIEGYVEPVQIQLETFIDNITKPITDSFMMK